MERLRDRSGVVKEGEFLSAVLLKMALLIDGVASFKNKGDVHAGCDVFKAAQV